MMEFEKYGRDLLNRPELPVEEREEIKAFVDLMALSNNRIIDSTQTEKTPMTISKAVEYLQVHRNTLARYVKKGMIPAFRHEGTRRLRLFREDIDAFITSGKSDS